MEPDFRQVEALFDQVVILETPALRAQFLDKTCGHNLELRQSIETLLAFHEAGTRFMSLPDPNETRHGVATLSEKPGTLIGRYKLLEQIGEGGFGVVFMAEQQQPVRRIVALKIIKLGMDTKQVIARFEAERQALALMDHPNIAKVLDAGATDTGRPYFVMELVRGLPITTFCNENKLSTRDRLNLFIAICTAVQHAHQKGIIHRDLKPSNILVTMHDDKPVPKIIDFGVAKATQSRLTEKTLFTEFKQMIGTPAYMSPEQAQMSGLDIDTRSDIYSLGVLLYELLTGTTPFDAKDLRSAAHDEMRRIIREVDPPAPSTRLSTLAAETLSTTATQRSSDPRTLNRLISGDLDWIALKCLEKDRSRRYETASGLASDIRRHMSEEPIQARPVTASYRFRKLIRRHKSGAVAVALVTFALLLGIIGTTMGFLGARNQAARAIEAERQAAKQRDQAISESRRADEQAAIAKAVNNFFNYVLAPDYNRRIDSDATPRRDLKVREVLDDFVPEVEKRFGNQPQVAAVIHGTLGQAFASLGDYKKSLQQYQAELQVYRDMLGDEDPLTRMALSRVLLSHMALREYDKAEVLADLILKIHYKYPERRGPADFYALENVADLYVRERKYSEAEPLLIEALAGLERTAGESDFRTLSTRYELANLCRNLGQTDHAIALYTQTLLSQRKYLGDAHPNTIATCLNLASILSTQKRYAEAEPLYRTVVAGRTLELGEGAPLTMTMRRSLAMNLTNSQKYAEAEQELWAQLVIEERVRPDDAYVQRVIRSQLIENFNQQKQYAQAEQEARDLLTIQERLLPPESSGILLSREALAITLLHEEKYAEAEKEYLQVLAIRQRVLHPEHPDRLKAQSALAEIRMEALRSTGKFAQAVAEAQKLVTEFEELLVVNPDSSAARDSLAEAHETMAWNQLFVHDFPAALASALAGLEVKPDHMGLESKRAFALLFLDRIPEAEEIFKKYTGKDMPGRLMWNHAILEDLAELEKAGLTSPQLPQIRALLQLPPPPPATTTAAPSR